MKCVNVQFHSVKEPSKNHDIWVRIQFSSGSCTFFLLLR